MIAYVTLGTNDLPRSAKFYDDLMAAMGAKRVMDLQRLILWGTSPATPMLAICTPYDGSVATVGNGVMVSLGVSGTEQVDALHRKAIELGGIDDGAPGPRGPGGMFYIGYFRDLDQNKLSFFCPARSAS